MDADALAETLKGVAAGEAGALERILPVVYQELRRLAASYLRGERAGHTLQPTALAHEAYLRLVGRQIAWQGRHHFMAVAASAMRAILVEGVVPSADAWVVTAMLAAVAFSIGITLHQFLRRGYIANY